MTQEILDSEGAYAAARLVPAAIRATLDVARRSGVPDDLDLGAVVLAASARSKLTATTVAAIATTAVARPVVSFVDERLPVWVGPSTLVVALDAGVAERLVTDTTVAGVPIIAVGGAVHDRPAPIVEAAAALAALDQFGLAPGLIADMEAACDLLDARLAELAASPSPADRLAKRIGRTMSLVYGGGAVGAAAAASWKHSINRNAKAPAFANSVPGLDHDEVCGWAQHGDVTRQVFTLAVLRHGFETSDQAHRLDVTAETCDEIVAGVHPVTSGATTAVGALFDLMLYGELVSLEMAARADIDPGPTPITSRYTD
ncbi:MAG: SIS domain-containing protein [Microthrixaceae bacterium]